MHISDELRFCSLQRVQFVQWGRQTAPWSEEECAVPGRGQGSPQAAHLCSGMTCRTPHMPWENTDIHSCNTCRELLICCTSKRVKFDRIKSSHLPKMAFDTWSSQMKWFWPVHTGGRETAAACNTGSCRQAGSSSKKNTWNFITALL